MRRGLFTLLILIQLALPACQSPREEPLRIGYIDWPGYEILYLAQQKSFLKEEKAPVLLKDFTSFSDLRKALQVGRLDGAVMSINEMLLSRLGKEYRVVYVLNVSHGADGIVGQPEIRSMADLKQKRIGVELTGLGGYVLTRALEKANMESADVVRINMTATIEAYSAFAEKQVDAVVTFEPILSRLIIEQRGNILFTSSEIPDEIINVLIFHEDVLKHRREDCLKVLRGYLKARQFWKAAPEEAITIMARRERVNPDYFRKSLNGLLIPDLSANLTYFGLADTENYFLETLKNFQNFMEQNHLLYEPVYFENLLGDLKGSAT
ncbi:MAG: ABC transporter substrate-binding protein [Nitrospirae bacterium]|nr:ABC transporter substrate-binding protein [Candidatus Manganitrophaceae bacterium]